MMVTNWFGVFTVLLASHSIVAMIAWIAGREGQDKTDNKISFDIHTGIKLRNKRVERKKTQERIAKVLNVTFQQIQKYEKGVNGLSGFHILQLSDFFKVPVTYFFEGFNQSIT